jgi:hypothetical protein
MAIPSHQGYMLINLYQLSKNYFQEGHTHNFPLFSGLISNSLKMIFQAEKKEKSESKLIEKKK